MADNDVYVDVRYDQDVAIVTMCRGDNRINSTFIEKFFDALDTILQYPDIKAVITTGQGRFYNNGVDVDWANTLSGEERTAFHDQLSAMFARILTFPLPTVAAINGHAFGAGGIMALAHDHVVMQTNRGWWCLNEVSLNIQVRPDVITLLRGKLAPGRSLQESVVLGRRFTAEDALSAGIVHEICAPVDLMPTALSWIRTSLPKSGYDRSHLEIMKKDVYKDVFHALKGRSSKL